MLHILTRPRFSVCVLSFILIMFLDGRPAAVAQYLTFHVSETAGLRRFGYPVTATLSIPEGILNNPDLFVMLDAAESFVPAQFTAMSSWPDGSIKTLDVDFTSDIGPLESQSFRVESTREAAKALMSGLSVTETANEIIVSSSSIRHRIRRDGWPLLSSVAVGETEFLMADGISTALKPGTAEVVKQGPFNVTVHLGDVRLEYVSSKSWVRITQDAVQATDLAVDAHFAMPELPLLWDFGAGGWLYGILGSRPQNAVLQVNSDNWQVFKGETDKPTLFATGRHCEGWGHLAGKNLVAAFGVLDSATGDPLKISVSGEGRFHSAARRKTLTVYFHFVTNPVQVSAVTSPQSMLAPLSVTIDPPPAGK